MVFALCLAASSLSFIFIGFPGICGFTGKYGDAIARTPFGFSLALGLFFLPVLGLVATAIWWIGTALLNLNRAR